MPALVFALIPIAALILFLVGNQLQDSEGSASPHIPLILAAAVASSIGLLVGISWKDIETGILKSIKVGMKAMLILCVIGILISTWIASGIVPMMIYYGLKFMNPHSFLFASCLICAVLSLATGSSWTTAGTIGIALIGVGKGLGVPLPMLAGAIISGAYFGDKMSPLSDSTNLASALAGSELFEHIGHMLYTTLPALILALIFYALLGIGFENEPVESVQTLLTSIDASFHLNPILLLPPIFIITLIFFRLPALPALFVSAMLGAIFAMIFQNISLAQIIDIAQNGYSAKTENEAIDALLNRGGLASMSETLLLILCALTFGGVMEACGFLRIIANAILKFARSTGSLIAATIGTCITMNHIAPDQYLSIIVPARMYQTAYEEKGLAPKNLSRTLEDAGTLSSPLVAWNTCGAYMSFTLAVPTYDYLPYCFLNLLTPIIAIVIASLGWGISKKTNST